MSNLIDLLGMNGRTLMRDRLCALPCGIGVPAKVAEGLFILRADRTVRILGAFRPGGVFVAALGTVKRQDRFNMPDIIAAKRILREHDIVSNGSASFIAQRAPTPRPTFRPTIIPPPQPAPPPAETSHTTPCVLFKTTPAEYQWAFVKTQDLLPPHAPLALSLCRLPRVHNALSRDELEPFVRGKLAAMDTHARMALGVLDDNTTLLLLGAAWGVELLMCRELTQDALRDDPDEQPPPEVQPPEAPSPALEDDLPPRIYWLHTRSVPRRRFLVEVVGDGRSRKSHRTGVKIPKVVTRTYLARVGRWTSPLLKPASWFQETNAAKPDDPFVRDALRKRDVSHKERSRE